MGRGGRAGPKAGGFRVSCVCCPPGGRDPAPSPPATPSLPPPQVFILYFKPSIFRCIVLRWVRMLGFAIVYGTITLKLYR